MRHRIAILLGALMALASFELRHARAELSQSSTHSPVVRWGGYLEPYYAFDFNGAPNLDRAYTTQPARHNEFNVNLAYVEAVVDRERLRGRLALQAGTSVQSNYASEPALGAVSGPSLSRHVQEATAGARIMDGLWIDAGIFFAHIGGESWISRQNPTYTRSLIADFSPYYETGVKVTKAWGSALSTQLLVVNGWQNISESNAGKSFGVQLAYSPTPSLSLTYNNLFGNELGTRFRHFHDWVAKLALGSATTLSATYDLGFQENDARSRSTLWQGCSLIGRYAFSETLAAAARVEYYSDPNQVIISTGSTTGFQAFGASTNIDVLLETHLTWRAELRGFWSKDRLFPTRDGSRLTHDGLLSTSVALNF